MDKYRITTRRLSPVTIDYLRRWYGWLIAGAEQNAPYDRNKGLCHNTYDDPVIRIADADKLAGKQSTLVFREICQVIEDFCGDSCIFHTIDYRMHGNKPGAPDCTLNPYRIGFVRKILAE